MKRKEKIIRNRIGAAFMAALSLFTTAAVEVQATSGSGMSSYGDPAYQAESTAYTYHVTPQPTWYVETTKSAAVYAEPFEDAEVLAGVPEHMIFIVTGAVDNGWCQVLYMGMTGYMTPADLQVYSGGEELTQLPVLETDAGYHVSFLGDSFTYGDKLASREQSYAALLAGMMQAVSYENNGLNGSCMGGEHPDRFVDRYVLISEDADLIFVLGGTNDYEFATPIGTMTDTDSRTFYGCLNLLMCGLQQKYPDAQIIFLTPLRRNRGTRKNPVGCTLEDYAYAMMNIGEFYDIPVMDLYHAQELNFVGNRRYLVDGLHPTALGHRRIADYLYNALFEAKE